MSYLYPVASSSDFGVVEIGANISVSSGVISVPQDIGPSSNVTFNTINGSTVITNVNPIAGTGIMLSNVTTGGPNVTFTISSTGTTTINTTAVNTATYTATVTDNYIGVEVSPCTITLPVGITGTEYTIKNETTSGSVTVIGSSGQKIDNTTSRSLGNNASLTVVFSRSQWRII